MKDFTNSNDFFEHVHTGTHIVDCYGSWCQPCKKLAPIVDEVAQETGAPICKVDIGAAFEVGSSLGVRGVPTILVLKDGVEVSRITGSISKDKLLQIVKESA